MIDLNECVMIVGEFAEYECSFGSLASIKFTCFTPTMIMYALASEWDDMA